MARLEVLFNELNRELPDETYVRSEMKEWLLEKGPNTTAKVEFFDGPLDNHVGCYIEVLQNGTLLRNFEIGKGLTYTFFQCLKGLNENERLEFNDPKNEERSA